MSNVFGFDEEQQSDDEGPGPPLFRRRTGDVESEADESAPDDNDMIEIRADDDVLFNFDESCNAVPNNSDESSSMPSVSYLTILLYWIN